MKGSVTLSTKDSNPKLSLTKTLIKRTLSTKTHIILIKLSILKAKGKKKDITLLSLEQNM